MFARTWEHFLRTNGKIMDEINYRTALSRVQLKMKLIISTEFETLKVQPPRVKFNHLIQYWLGLHQVMFNN